MPPSGTIIAALRGLHPTQFENVVYDLVTCAGLRNTIWRTPGADGGRDIEGELPTTDFSGFHVTMKWYVECKRYASSVDWPTVWGKIAYAENHAADFLLIVTTSALSPQCKTEVSTWNGKRRRPAVRFWDETSLEQVLMQYPGVLVKHGLAADSKLTPASFMLLAEKTSRVVQAAFGVSEMANQDNAALEAASALSELLTVRIADAESGRKFRNYPFQPAIDGYRWLSITGDMAELSSFDRHGLRAILTLLRHVTGHGNITAALKAGMIRISIPTERLPNSAATLFLTDVSFWSDLEIRLDGHDFIISRRL
jgi:hypothetical protein